MRSIDKVKIDEGLFFKIKELVEKYGLTQRNAARACGIDEKKYSAWKIKREKTKTAMRDLQQGEFRRKKYIPSPKFTKFGTNCLGVPFRVHKNEDILLNGKIVGKFDEDLKLTGFLVHQLCAGIILDYYTKNDHLSPETVAMIKYVSSHGRNHKNLRR